MEIKCKSGQTVTATFTKVCRNREVMAYRHMKALSSCVAPELAAVQPTPSASFSGQQSLQGSLGIAAKGIRQGLSQELLHLVFANVLARVGEY